MKMMSLLAVTLIGFSAQASDTNVNAWEDMMDHAEVQSVLPNEGYVCAARGPKGHIFRAFGYLPVRVQKRAYYKCEKVTNGCKPLGCRPIQ